MTVVTMAARMSADVKHMIGTKRRDETSSLYAALLSYCMPATSLGAFEIQSLLQTPAKQRSNGLQASAFTDRLHKLLLRYCIP